MKHFLTYLFAICNIYLFLQYDFSLLEMGIGTINCVLAALYFYRIQNYRNHIFVLFLFFYLFCSNYIFAIFEFNGIGFFKNVITWKEYRNLAIWGNHLFLVLFVLANIVKGKRSKKQIELKAVDRRSVFTENMFVRITIFTYILSVISKLLGISDMMNPPKVILPLHLNGIIDELRGNLYPFVFAIYIYDCIRCERKIPHKSVVLFCVYAILEVVVRTSKGALISSFFPVLELIALLGIVKRRMVVRYFIPLVLASYLMYPIIGLARSAGDVSLEGMMSAYNEYKTASEEEKTSPFVRFFMTGIYYIKVESEINNDYLSFDFRHVPYLALRGGGGVYMTREIDGVPEGMFHSSGITGLTDALLWGGHLMCIIVMALIMIIALVGDNSKLLSRKPLYRLFLFSLFYIFVVQKTLSYFIDALFFSSLISLLLKLLITKLYYNKMISKV